MLVRTERADHVYVAQCCRDTFMVRKWMCLGTPFRGVHCTHPFLPKKRIHVRLAPPRSPASRPLRHDHCGCDDDTT